MNDLASRQEVLDLLSKGKINIDEALAMLNQSDHAATENSDQTVYKADELTVPEGSDVGDQVDDIKLAEKIPVDEMPEEEGGILEKAAVGSNKSRWLRIKVTNLDTGKNKVSVNVPWGLVNFGLDLANIFSPGDSGKLDKIRNKTSTVEKGLLLDVEDNDSNEHVQIFVD